MKKILNILLGVLMAITAVLLIYAIATGGSETAVGLNLNCHLYTSPSPRDRG